MSELEIVTTDSVKKLKEQVASFDMSHSNQVCIYVQMIFVVLNSLVQWHLNIAVQNLYIVAVVRPSAKWEWGLCPT